MKIKTNVLTTTYVINKEDLGGVGQNIILSDKKKTKEDAVERPNKGVSPGTLVGDLVFIDEQQGGAKIVKPKPPRASTKRVVMPVSSLIGKGYNKFWLFRGRYRVVKGSRASKKSRTTAYWIILNMMKPEYKLANTLVVRKTERTLKDSCYAELQWVIYKLNCMKSWICKTNPLEMTYIPTGQKILFRGMDEPLKLTSISVPVGHLCWVWVEEAYEIDSLSDFDLLDESIRGLLPEPLFHQFTITFNPWTSSHWLKKRFFDVEDEDILAITTTYQINEWIDSNYVKMLEKLKERNPKRYKVAALGEWGAMGNQVYENYHIATFDPRTVPGFWVFGLDFGYSNDPTAFFVGKVDLKEKIIYVINEFYENGLWNDQIATKIYEMGYGKEVIYADSSAPKDISELVSKYGLRRIIPCRKGKDSILNGVGFIQQFTIIIHPRCNHFFFEIENYVYKKDKRTDEPKNEPEDKYNHLMDAMRYALEPYILGSLITFA